eukprot:Nitzschia sp. Nitz4//scaffold68_size99682//11589//12617//NITZ4_004552-RA/size99682-processed-gene-0.34-mRNA-1//-1//CDS//3329556557//4869//frame0
MTESPASGMMPSLPRMGLGMAALGRPGYITLHRSNDLGSADQRGVEAMKQRSFSVLDELFQLHKNDQNQDSAPVWIDCARSYGLSEEFVRDYLRKHNVAPSEVYVSSKWGYTYVADFHVTLPPGQKHEVKDHSKQNFLKQLQETKVHLGEYINLYQIHSATFDSGVLTDTQVHEALAECRRTHGWALGLSVSGTQQGEILREAMQLKDSKNRPLFDSVQCTYNVMEQTPHDMLVEAHQKGVDIIVKEGLANGRVMENPVVLKYSQKLGCSPDQLALACVLAQPFAPHVLSGAATPDHLRSNLKAEALSQRLLQDPALLEEIMLAARQDVDAYWTERSSLAWN